MKVLFLTFATLLLVSGQSVDIHTKDVYLIVKGVIEGVKVDEHIEVSEIVSCLNDSEELINNLVKAITALETQTFDGVKEGIKLIGVAIQQIPDAITACESGSQEMIALSSIQYQVNQKSQLIYWKNLEVHCHFPIKQATTYLSMGQTFIKKQVIS
ncbi:hypothetical protein FGO68_gene1519 [Halteria grandinella]|uniref:Uncharacterized protein n=1 Tax=Halteria grandinella TaxID=5974 RepID=A0A8J8NGN7_HALGN|nr:hypothetical protein FGO68_gene1519 [Halteria grandinella]